MRNRVSIIQVFKLSAIASVFSVSIFTFMLALLATANVGTAVAAPNTDASTLSSAVGSWAQITSTNAGPSPRYDHTSIFDPMRNQLVMFGGRGSGTLGDTWVLDLTMRTWREITGTTKPAPRFGHGAVYDASHRRMLMTMGEGSSFFNDVWSFNLDSEVWTVLKASSVISTSPPARYGQSAALDSQGRLLISHGFTTQGRFDDTWAFDSTSAAWVELSPTSGIRPLKRCLHSLAYDAASNRLFMFGGCASGFGPCPLNDLWAFDLQSRTWAQLSPSQGGGDEPSARSNPSLVWREKAQQLVAIGGQTASGLSIDAWGFGLRGAWRKLTDAGQASLSSRASHSANEDAEHGRIWVFGGRTASGASNDVWVWEFWQELYLPVIVR